MGWELFGEISSGLVLSKKEKERYLVSAMCEDSKNIAIYKPESPGSQNPALLAPDLELPASRNGRNKMLIVKATQSAFC